MSDVQAFARELHASASRDEADSAFLQDVARGRYPMVALQRLMAIAARSEKPEHHEFLAEVVRRECAPMAAACFVEASTAETLSTGPADVAQYEFYRAPCRSTAMRLRDALLHQKGATTNLLRSLMSHTAWQ